MILFVSNFPSNSANTLHDLFSRLLTAFAKKGCVIYKLKCSELRNVNKHEINKSKNMNSFTSILSLRPIIVSR